MLLQPIDHRFSNSSILIQKLMNLLGRTNLRFSIVVVDDNDDDTDEEKQKERFLHFPDGNNELIFSQFSINTKKDHYVNQPRKHIKLTNFENLNDVAMINSLTHTQYQKLGIVALSFEQKNKEEHQEQEEEEKQDHDDDDDDDFLLEPFVIPKSFRKGEVDFSNDEMTNSQGPIPTRRSSSSSSSIQQEQPYYYTKFAKGNGKSKAKIDRVEEVDHNHNSYYQQDDGVITSSLIMNMIILLFISAILIGWYCRKKSMMKKRSSKK